jgi:hypothetical protein
MLGDIDAAFACSAAEIDDLELPEANHGAAVDLGAGLGLHALPLARRGFRVTAIDSCQVLLDELRSRSGTLAVTAVNADLVDYRAVVKEGAAGRSVHGRHAHAFADLGCSGIAASVRGGRLGAGRRIRGDIPRLRHQDAGGR